MGSMLIIYIYIYIHCSYGNHRECTSSYVAGSEKKNQSCGFQKKETSLAGRRAGRAQVRFSRADFNIGPVFDSRWKHIYLFSNYAGSIPLRCILKHSVVFDPRWNRRQRLPLYRIKC